MATTGTYTLEDLKGIDPTVTVEDFGEAEATAVAREELEAHNTKYLDMAGVLMVTTTERTSTYGSGGIRRLQRVDENGRAVTKKSTFKGGTFGLPVDRYQDALGWNRDFIINTPVSRFAREMINMQDGDVDNLFNLVQAALFVPTNYTFYDYLVDDAELAVKRLLNGDGDAIPANRAGVTFNGGTHTHYLGAAAWSNEAVDALIATVREHDHTGRLVIYINASNVSSISLLSKFRPAVSDRVIYGDGVTRANITLDNSRDDNRVVGLWADLYDIETRPWMPAGYAFVYDTQADKPLAMRLPVAATLQGLRLVGDIDIYPLRANYWERRVGVGVRTRTNGAVGFMNGGTYTSPPGLT